MSQELCIRFPCHSLKTESCYDANFLVTGGNAGCRYDNLQCHQWQQCWHNGNSQFSLLGFGTSWFYPYPLGLLHWHWGNHTIAPVPVKQPWRIWVNRLCWFIANDNITTTKQSTANLWALFMEYTVHRDYIVYAPNQWETTLQCNIIFHWLGAYTKRSLCT